MSSTAAALLLTTVAASAPLNSRSIGSTRIIPIATATRTQIELQIDGRGECTHDRLHKRTGEQRATEIGM